MKNKKRIISFVVYSILLLVIGIVNLKWKFIQIPKSDEIVNQQIDYITISTVFAGFSFTALGLLLGLSSEQLIEKIKNTDIIMDKVGRIISSIVFFILSVVVSLFFVLGLDDSLIANEEVLLLVDNVLYVVGVGYLICGIFYFVYAVYELYDLIKRVYGYNKKITAERIDVAKKQMEEMREKMRQAENNMEE